MNFRTKRLLERLVGPSGSVVFHIVLVIILANMAFYVIKKDNPVEAQIMEVEQTDLEEFKKELEKIDDLPDTPTVDAPAVQADKPPEAETVVEDKFSALDILNAPSPLVMKGMYAGRLAGGTRSKMLKDHAGAWGAKTEAAVLKALRWLKKVQQSDGSWTGAEAKYTSGITGLGLLTFLAHGETTASEEFGPTVEKAVRYLIGAQHESGAFFDPSQNSAPETTGGAGWGGNQSAPYWHAMATYAVCEGYGLMRIPELKPVMEKAVKIIIDGQQPGGGWNYSYTKVARRDTSILGWQVQSLKACTIAGGEVEGITNAMAKAIEDLKIHQDAGGLFCYESFEADAKRGDFNFRLRNNTGIAVLSLQLLGQGLSKEAKNGIEALRAASCTWSTDDEWTWPLYGWYYITQAKFHHGGNDWTLWNDKFARVLTENQKDDGHWDSPPVNGQPGGEDRYGPVYCTTFAALTLQVYYRFLPTYQAKAVTVEQISGETAADDAVIKF